MYQKSSANPLSVDLPPLSGEVFDSMWQIFVHIGKFWQNMDNPEPLKSRLYTFMVNRISLRPIYKDYYVMAAGTMAALISENGEEQAYTILFTDPEGIETPPTTPLGVTRQMVANEFIAWQLALGGFKAWSAINYCGYIGGANVPGQPAPYRTFKDQP
ncbi:MAG TPA: hypothetical protein VGN86_14055 [Pyrinomonadaceae bacterium]|jgi:hypothetical protein|nr:hypothetical protein [Pyrinomonadaceae bacterium]